MQQSFLTVKLNELENEQGRLLARIRLCQKEDAQVIRKEKEKIRTECEEEDLLLQHDVDAAHSKAVSALAEAQLAYNKKIDEITENILPESIHGRESYPEDKAEARMLYAEFCIDFAVRAEKNALRAALEAIESEMECEEWRKERE